MIYFQNNKHLYDVDGESLNVMGSNRPSVGLSDGAVLATSLASYSFSCCVICVILLLQLPLTAKNPTLIQADLLVEDSVRFRSKNAAFVTFACCIY